MRIRRRFTFARSGRGLLAPMGVSLASNRSDEGAPKHRRLTALAAGSLIAGFMAVPVLVPLSAATAGPAAAATSHAKVPHLTPVPSNSHPHNLAHVSHPLLGVAPQLATTAVTFTVNTTSDTHDATPGDGICADSGGLCSLRAAIEEANADGAANPAMGTTGVVLPAGTYTLSLGTSLDATDPAGIDIAGAGAGSTVIQQMASPTHGVLIVSTSTAAGADVVLSGVTVQGGSAGSTGGGGISVNDTNDALQLVNDTVTKNVAGYGGGIYNDGNLWVTNSNIVSNGADDTDGEPAGAGLYNDGLASLTNTVVYLNNAFSTDNNEAIGGGVYQDGSLVVEGGSISDNTAQTVDDSAYGGGLYVDSTTALSGVAIDNNTASASAADDEDAYGGGIYSEFGLDSITSSDISGNVASGYFANGGGINVYYGGPTITGSTLDNNQANGDGDTAYGGAISTYYEGSIAVSNSTFTGNSANDPVDGGFGGAIMAYEYGGITVTGSSFTDNAATGPNEDNYGGAIFSEAYYPGTSISSSTFTGNSAADGYGGALYDENYSTTLINDVFNQNNVLPGPDGDGGALYLDYGGDLEGTTVSNNTAGSLGGGVYSSDSLIVKASTVSGNSANLGGGLYLDDSLQAENATIANNSTTGSGDQGGGIYSDGETMSLRFVTIAGNTSDDGAPIYNNDGGGSIASSIVQAGCDMAAGSTLIGSAGNNVLGDSTCVQPTSSDQSGVNNLRLGPLGNNGGPAPTMVPLTNSPAIGAGGTVCPPTDERGVARPQGAACDAGAVEVGQSYWEVASDGGIFNFGGAGFFGSMGGKHLNKPIVGIAAAPDGNGYWEAASDGGVFNFGPSAGFHGSAGSLHLNAPVVGIAATPDGGGYWLVASDGGIFNYGDAGFFGSMGGKHLNKPIVGVAAAAGGGYWEVASDGGIFNFGPGAGFHGSAGSLHLNAPVVGISGTPDGGGYWTVASDGGIFNYGDAGFFGSMGGKHLNKPVVGVAGSPVGQGYWEAATDGGIFNFGDAGFQGSMGGIPLNQPVVGIAST